MGYVRFQMSTLQNLEIDMTSAQGEHFVCAVAHDDAEASDTLGIHDLVRLFVRLFVGWLVRLCVCAFVGLWVSVANDDVEASDALGIHDLVRLYILFSSFHFPDFLVFCLIVSPNVSCARAHFTRTYAHKNSHARTHVCTRAHAHGHQDSLYLLTKTHLYTPG